MSGHRTDDRVSVDPPAVDPGEFRRGRHFRVIKSGSRLEHGDYGESAGSIPLAIGTVLTFRGWLSNGDGDSGPIWEAIDGQPITGISGVDPYFDTPWAEFRPSVPIADGTSPASGWCFSMPDATYLEPVTKTGRPQAWGGRKRP